MTCCVVDLPFPPSVNHIWRKGRSGFHKSAKYKAWLEEAGKELLRQRPQKISGEYRIRFCLTPPDKRRRDQDNYIKAVSDLLVQHGVIDDDSFAIETVIKWIRASNYAPGVRVVIEGKTA